MKKKIKKLWLLERTDRVGYDEYDSAVLCAFSRKEAFAVQTIGDASKMKCKFIGTAAAAVKLGAVLESFNAG